jgi:hypothetical protein
MTAPLFRDVDTVLETPEYISIATLSKLFARLIDCLSEAQTDVHLLITGVLNQLNRTTESVAEDWRSTPLTSVKDEHNMSESLSYSSDEKSDWIARQPYQLKSYRPRYGQSSRPSCL